MLSKRKTVTIDFTMTQELSWTGTVADLMSYTDLSFDDVQQAFVNNADFGPLAARLYTIADPSRSVIVDESYEIDAVAETDRE